MNRDDYECQGILRTEPPEKCERLADYVVQVGNRYSARCKKCVRDFTLPSQLCVLVAKALEAGTLPGLPKLLIDYGEPE